MRKIFTFLAAVTVTAAMYATEGALSGKFTINADGDQIQFSQGNLQYQASTNTWRFAENQWDIVGMGYGQTNERKSCCIGGTVVNSDNRQISATYTGWIDLFGWGTGNNPTKASTVSNYSTFTDWGINVISNGGNIANAWRTLTSDEWVYLFETRTDASSKYGAAKVNGVTGIVILPDEWSLPSGCGFIAGLTDPVEDYYDWSLVVSSNIYNTAQWSQMESAGAVFLPAAGYRSGTDVYAVGSIGFYWSATLDDESNAYGTIFIAYSLDPQYSAKRRAGRSVRLVRQADDTNGIEQISIQPSAVSSQKVFHDGALYILRPDGAIFNAQGAKVK